jgi:GNAT superfamily N-acetyltransferase
VIRPACREDARTLAELEVRAWRWAYVDIVDEPEMITVGDREARWASGPLEGVSVAVVEDRVVGVVQQAGRETSAERSAGRLRGLYVEPAAQGAGVGTALYLQAMGELRAAGFAGAILWTFAANGHARGFFERRGWIADGATAKASGASVLRYRHTLAP